jgi:BlaI family transcriptional regulator, penicillinase repressor
MGDLPRISDAEWEVMRVIWKRHPIDAGAVANEVCARRDWSERTVKTLLSRLVRKGVLGFEVDGKRYLYHPLIEREDSVREASRSFLDRVFGGAARPALVHFVKEAELTPAEIRELRKLLKQKDGRP